VFCGESMFSREADASKVALARLVEGCLAESIVLIDCQMPSAHLRSLGSRPVPRDVFLGALGATDIALEA
jgi:leucyl/phenylalanyl-tRNA--protein transferase